MVEEPCAPGAAASAAAAADAAAAGAAAPSSQPAEREQQEQAALTPRGLTLDLPLGRTVSGMSSSTPLESGPLASPHSTSPPTSPRSRSRLAAGLSKLSIFGSRRQRSSERGAGAPGAASPGWESPRSPSPTAAEGQAHAQHHHRKWGLPWRHPHDGHHDQQQEQKHHRRRHHGLGGISHTGSNFPAPELRGLVTPQSMLVIDFKGGRGSGVGGKGGWQGGGILEGKGG